MTVRKFKKKPVVVEAIQFISPSDEVFRELDEFTGGLFRLVDIDDNPSHGDDPLIQGQVYDALHKTWIGVKRMDWIIKGTQGEFYPCDSGTFVEIYEPVE